MKIFKSAQTARHSTYAFSIVALYYIASRACGLSLAILNQPVAMTLVMGTQLLFLFFTYGGFEFLKMVGRVFRGNPTELDARRIRHTVNVGFLGAGVGFLLGVVVMLTNLAGPELLAKGSVIAISSLLWAFLVALLLQFVNRDQ